MLVFNVGVGMSSVLSTDELCCFVYSPLLVMFRSILCVCSKTINVRSLVSSGRPSHTVVVDVFVAVSVTRSFFFLDPGCYPEPNSLSWTTGMHISSGFSKKDLSGLAGPTRSIRLLPAQLLGSLEHTSHPAAARRTRLEQRRVTSPTKIVRK